MQSYFHVPRVFRHFQTTLFAFVSAAGVAGVINRLCHRCCAHRLAPIPVAPHALPCGRAASPPPQPSSPSRRARPPLSPAPPPGPSPLPGAQPSHAPPVFLPAQPLISTRSAPLRVLRPPVRGPSCCLGAGSDHRGQRAASLAFLPTPPLTSGQSAPLRVLLSSGRGPSLLCGRRNRLPFPSPCRIAAPPLMSLAVPAATPNPTASSSPMKTEARSATSRVLSSRAISITTRSYGTIWCF